MDGTWLEKMFFLMQNFTIVPARQHVCRQNLYRMHSPPMYVIRTYRLSSSPFLLFPGLANCSQSLTISAVQDGKAFGIRLAFGEGLPREKYCMQIIFRIQRASSSDA